MNLVFPLAQMSNTMSMTGLLILINLSGNSELTAEIGMVQAASLALLMAFSASGRSLIFNEQSKVTSTTIICLRLALIVPLSLATYILSVISIDVAAPLAAALILRRCVEWLAEAYLSELELRHRTRDGAIFLALQIVSFAILCINILISNDMLYGILLWAAAPAVLLYRPVLASLPSLGAVLTKLPKELLPNFGSTAIIGVGVYAFRLLILVMVGKEVSGELYSAFALGGLFGTVFAQALGPTIALQSTRAGNRNLPALIVCSLVACVLLGTGVIGATIYFPNALPLGQTSKLFWLATGASLLGSVVMVFAQRIRFELIQNSHKRDVFGPDVIANIVLICSIPYLYYIGGRFIGGPMVLAFCYFWSSIINFIFYFSSYLGYQRLERPNSRALAAEKVILLIILIVPVFFQLAHGIFSSSNPDFTPRGHFVELPLPLGILAGYGGIALLGYFQRARSSLITIFALFVTMLIVTRVNFSGIAAPLQEQSRIIQLTQIVIPSLGLVLGQMMEMNGTIARRRDFIEKTFLSLAPLFMFAHMVMSWSSGSVFLVPNLGVFSIFQYQTYVPIVLVAAASFAQIRLWSMPTFRHLIPINAALSSIYLCASQSWLVLPIYLAGQAVWVIGVRHREGSGYSLQTLFAAMLSPIAFYLGALNISGVTAFYGERSFFGVFAQAMLAHSRYVNTEILGEMRSLQMEWGTLLLGNTSPPLTLYPHLSRYYLFDLLYNFGLVGTLPFFAFIGYTAYLTAKLLRAPKRDETLLLLAVILFVLIVPGSIFAEVLSQPYSGIFTFFLWGIYLSRAVESCGHVDAQQARSRQESGTV